MKKRIISLLLCLVMVIGLLPVAAFAADLPFNDVKAGAWYYNDVKIAYEGDLISGKSKTVFDPDANLTYAEAVKLAACMHQKSTTGEVTLTSGNPWYQTYVDYCRDNGIIGKDKNYEWNTNATRAGYMAIFAYALPDESLRAVNSVADGSIPDVPMSYPEAKEIYKLYRAGILLGVNDRYSCNPDANIKRCEVAAILTRMMNDDKRLSFTIGKTDHLTITSQPQDITAANGDKVSLSVAVSGGKAPYTYTWQRNSQGRWENITDSVNAWSYGTDILSVMAYKNTWMVNEDLRCIVTDADGSSVTSNSVRVSLEVTPLTITAQPQDVTASAGEKVSLSVGVSGGKAPYSYAWQRNSQGRWENITDSVDAWSYGTDILSVMAYKNTWMVNEDLRCIITDADGSSVTSSSVRVSLETEPLTITAQPQDITAANGDKVSLSVAVSGGKAPYTYTWQSNSQGRWENIADSVDAWSYGDDTLFVMAYKNTWMVNESIRCIVTDADGNSVTSSSARVRIG